MKFALVGTMFEELRMRVPTEPRIQQLNLQCDAWNSVHGYTRTVAMKGNRIEIVGDLFQFHLPDGGSYRSRSVQKWKVELRLVPSHSKAGC